jgi:tetratricopeptide (TPR) repeat protein
LQSAYAGLADCYADLGNYRWLPPQDAYRQANAAVQKALELDQGLSEAHATVGMLNWQYRWDWPAAEKELRNALNSNYVEGDESLVWYLAWSGRREEAQAEVEKMRALDPVYPSLFIQELGIDYHQRDYKSLVEASKKSVIANPGV